MNGQGRDVKYNEEEQKLLKLLLTLYSGPFSAPFSGPFSGPFSVLLSNYRLLKGLLDEPYMKLVLRTK